MTDLERFIDKAVGSMIGLAIGDALGTTLEFKPKDSYEPITDLIGGGPFSLKAGEWTDDTSMMLCLADSLYMTGQNDLKDQLERYVDWARNGRNSVTGKCFDMGKTVRQALVHFLKTGELQAGNTDDNSAGNGSLMRVAPIPIFFSPVKGISVERAMQMAKESSLTTHGEQRAYESCMLMTWLLYQIYDDKNKDITKNELLKSFKVYWKTKNIHQDLKVIVEGSYLEKNRDEVQGYGFVVASFEAALWSFYHSDNYQEGALLAANLGEDADTTAAIYGQLAGAFYGYSQLPIQWLTKLAWHDHIIETAKLLVQHVTKSTFETLSPVQREYFKSVAGYEYMGQRCSDRFMTDRPYDKPWSRSPWSFSFHFNSYTGDLFCELDHRMTNNRAYGCSFQGDELDTELVAKIFPPTY